MRNSLLFKLLGAFLLVTLIGSALMFLMVSLSTQSAFTLYTTRSGQAWAARLAPLLADYYANNSGWQGVETFIFGQTPEIGSGGVHGMGGGMGGGPNAGQGMGAGRVIAGGMMMGSGMRVILSDPDGRVFEDTTSDLTGKQLSPDQLKNGVPVVLNGQTIALVLVTPNDLNQPASPAAEFLTSVNRSILIAALLAALAALILGSFLFFQITAPLRQLKEAAASIAKGDLSRRVKIDSKDELGEVGRTFNHMADSLSRSEKQRHAMVADIAHELRTPLTVMRANLEGLMDDVLPLDQEHVQAVYAETLLLNRLVDDLRLLSLAEAGELKLESGPVDLTMLVQQVVTRTQPQAAQKGITLDYEPAPSLPAVFVDADRLTQVINNLIGNALRYTPQNGRIKLNLTQPPDSPENFILSVTDNGSGIDPQALPLIFERFYRADKSRTRSSGGTGLGLAIVKQLVEAHGGKIEVFSPVFFNAEGQGYGSRFVVTLPIFRNEK
ncbi:MAG: ATP-binding protein [Anaerolineae bacterium]|nr:ATP-binding protein [Anaerolineae bacterium]